MVEIKSIACNSIESIDTLNINNQQFRLNKISEIEEYFIVEIEERELMSKKIQQIYIYIYIFYYFDKSLVVLSVTSGGVSIESFATAIGAPIGITSASFSLTILLCTGLVKKLLKAKGNKKRSITQLLC